MDAGFWVCYREGLRAARVDAILAGTGVTKGAFYHHFATKLALAEAVVADVVGPMIEARWVEPVRASADPVDGLRRAVRALEQEDRLELLLGGCPLFNLLQDVADSNGEAPVRDRLLALLADWRARWSADLTRGQASGHVRRDLHPDLTAAFLIATYHGLAGTARADKSPSAMRRLLRTYATLIDTLRPA